MVYSAAAFAADDADALSDGELLLVVLLLLLLVFTATAVDVA